MCWDCVRGREGGRERGGREGRRKGEEEREWEGRGGKERAVVLAY